MIEFFVPHELKPKGNSKRAWPGAKYPTHPPEVKTNAAALALFCAEHRPTQPFDCPVTLIVDVVYPWLGKHKKERSLGRIPKATAPDVCNLSKQLNDVLEATGFVVNDARIVDSRLRKWYGDTPGVQVRIGKAE